MATIVHSFNFTADLESTTVDISKFFGTKWGLLIRGIMLAKSIEIAGGDGTTFEDIKVVNPSDATIQNTLLPNGIPGMWMFNACCTSLRFTANGTFPPNLDIDLYAEPRP